MANKEAGRGIFDNSTYKRARRDRLRFRAHLERTPQSDQKSAQIEFTWGKAQNNSREGGQSA